MTTPPTIIERRAEDGRLLATVGLNPANELEGPFVAYDEAGRPHMRMACRAGQPRDADGWPARSIKPVGRPNSLRQRVSIRRIFP